MVASACASGSTSNEVATNERAVAPETSNATADAGDDDSTASANDDASPGTASSGSAVDQGGTPMSASSPIGAFFDGGFDEAIAEYRIRVNETIVVCMAAQGFEFAVNEDGGTNDVEERQNELTVREWTSEYGFGISTSFDSVARNRSSDPNTAIFLSMSPSEREIWAETLSGGDIGDATSGDFGSRPLEEQGCIGQALIETGGQDALKGLSEFGDVYEEGEAALFDGREMIQALDAWARCMSESGFPNYAKLNDPEDAISEEFGIVTAPLTAALDEISDEEAQALISGESFDIESLPDLDVAALREVQAKEISLALADLDCYEAEVQTIYEPLRDDYENGLLTEYAAEFDALKNIGS